MNRIARWIDLVQDEEVCTFLEIDSKIKKYLVELEENEFLPEPEEFKTQPVKEIPFQSKSEHTVCQFLESMDKNYK